MPRAYENLVLERDVSLGIENLFMAPYPTTFDPTTQITDVLDIGSSWPGFVWLGAVVEDTPQLTVSREKFQLMTGIPKSLQYEAITQVAGKFECSLYTISPRRTAYALGNVDPLNVTKTGGTSFASINSVTNKYIVTLAGTPAGGLSVNDYIVTASATTGIAQSVNEAQVSSINGLTIVFGTPSLLTTPSANHFLAKITAVKQPYGTKELRKYALVGLADFVDGAQVIHYLPKVAPGGEFVEAIRPDDVGKIPLSFDAYALSNSDYGVSGLVVGHRYWLPR